MSKRSINGSDFTAMALLGAEMLQQNVDRVNALNVFPVPDGDTGTNMNLTIASGVRELRSKPSDQLGKATEAMSKGLLMGARGNSGVILSQLFRGFSKALANLDEAGTTQVAAAFQQGVDMAYKAVVKPVEGTILTVAKEAAKHAVQHARRTNDVVELMREVHAKAHEALQRTPDLLPILKQVGVVDSGGQGLVFIYEGFVRSLTEGSHSQDAYAFQSEAAAPEEVAVAQPVVEPRRTSSPSATSAQSRLSTEDIEFLYDMEFFIKRNVSGNRVPFFDEYAFKKALEKDGDSILVIVEDDIIKVHVHSRKPGDVFNLALPYGELTDMHILNMREQHRELLIQEGDTPAFAAVPEYALSGDISSAQLLAGTDSQQVVPPGQVHEWAPFGIIAVAMGEGITNIFLGNEVDIVLSGGQTMNPSTEDFLKAIESLPAEHIYLLPNNGNIILAAEQAAELSERNVTVIPTKTIPQGLSAILAFKEEESAERNAAWMKNAAEQVLSGQVTHAVRDTSIDGVDIREGDYIAIKEKGIIAASKELQQACQLLIASMMEQGGDLLTVLTGEDAEDTDIGALSAWMEETYPDVELELLEGGQPLYPYLFALE
ncbi:DAK2 domain-containing protein [Paenibacillus radicis (ex Gao et al. 2016)]|uniref:Phosphatase n=1 Tax=Paenibacillus radicis (ex Gao et al. 2016) TaxID=1737354 RepID=A0A917HL69_9BACL|nr:DAK2 domain-containing protein [Paenibacillus radicis (ex Gao et al. 2016)]GGG82741.1 phosphatase [Paenibacillus radicis (ex Gao et al. 2016)]